MRQVRLVKCMLVHNGGPPSDNNLRYVPLQEYRLWEFYMQRKYGWRVAPQSVSTWFSEEAHQQLGNHHASDSFERVNRIRIEYLAGDHLIVSQERFFPESEYEFRKDQFLKHYPVVRLVRGIEMNARRVEETSGYYLKAPAPSPDSLEALGAEFL